MRFHAKANWAKAINIVKRKPFHQNPIPHFLGIHMILQACPPSLHGYL